MHFTLQMAGADMSVSMLQLLLLNAVTQAAVPLTDSTLTTDPLQSPVFVDRRTHTHTHISHQEDL
jgi:hypothetical protein